MHDYVRIVLPTPCHNNYGIECWLSDRDQAKRFEALCLSRFPSDEFGTFWQGGHNDREWRYFEFWNGRQHQDAILAISEEIAAEFGHDLTFDIPQTASTARCP